MLKRYLIGFSLRSCLAVSPFLYNLIFLQLLNEDTHKELNIFISISVLIGLIAKFSIDILIRASTSSRRSQRKRPLNERALWTLSLTPIIIGFGISPLYFLVIVQAWGFNVGMWPMIAGCLIGLLSIVSSIYKVKNKFLLSQLLEPSSFHASILVVSVVVALHLVSDGEVNSKSANAIAIIAASFALYAGVCIPFVAKIKLRKRTADLACQIILRNSYFLSQQTYIVAMGQFGSWGLVFYLSISDSLTDYSSSILILQATMALKVLRNFYSNWRSVEFSSEFRLNIQNDKLLANRLLRREIYYLLCISLGIAIISGSFLAVVLVELNTYSSIFLIALLGAEIVSFASTPAFTVLQHAFITRGFLVIPVLQFSPLALVYAFRVEDISVIGLSVLVGSMLRTLFLWFLFTSNREMA